MSGDTQQMIARGPTVSTASKSPWNTRHSKIVDLAKELSKTRGEALSRGLNAFFEEFDRVRAGEMHLVYQAIAILAQADGIGPALQSLYERTPEQAFTKRYRILQLIGELRDPRLLKFLVEVVRTPLPEKGKAKAELDSAREREETIQAKAVQGIGYLRDSEGRLVSDAIEALVAVMVDHPSLAVRVEAIDVYMWNHGDAPAAASRLYAILPKELHKFVERPRVHRGSNAASTSQRIDAWHKKWGTR
jgi:hypothetical protein